MTTTIETIIADWQAGGYDTVAQSRDGRCYPCRAEDIPSGALDSYAPLGSNDAREMISASLAEDWTY